MNRMSDYQFSDAGNRVRISEIALKYVCFVNNIPVLVLVLFLMFVFYFIFMIVEFARLLGFSPTTKH